MLNKNVFHAYDIRGNVPSEIDADGAARIAEGIFFHFKPKTLQIGMDMRVSSEEFYKAMLDKFLSLGVDVVSLGLVSTDMLYFATGKYKEDMGIMVSASHNPKEYNGMKIVLRGARPVSAKNGLNDIAKFALSNEQLQVLEKKGELSKRDLMDQWVEHVLGFVDIEKIGEIKVVVDAGNGMAGHFMPPIEKRLPIKSTHLFYDLDGTFPNHTPNPLKAENLKDLIGEVKKSEAEVGLAFDGDGDRLFLVDEKGKAVSGTALTAMIADRMVRENSGGTVLYNAVIGRVVPKVVEKAGGKAVRVRVGHSHIKDKMRELNAVFAGEHSGHYYFQDNYFADSAIIPALMVLEMISTSGKSLSELVAEYNIYFQSGEINFDVSDKKEVMKKIESQYKLDAKSVDWLDGLSVWFDDWWFSLRESNTEPKLRLNMEADSEDILKRELNKLTEMIKGLGGVRS